jgi:hypothetical protein
MGDLAEFINKAGAGHFLSEKSWLLLSIAALTSS